jgi:hypothetical protein
MPRSVARIKHVAFQLEQLAAEADSVETVARTAMIAAMNESLFISPPPLNETGRKNILNSGAGGAQAQFFAAVRRLRHRALGPPRVRTRNIVLATDYPREIRQREPVRDFVRDLRALGPSGEQILSGNVGRLLKQPAKAA